MKDRFDPKPERETGTAEVLFDLRSLKILPKEIYAG
jgi:hypothetical protein